MSKLIIFEPHPVQYHAPVYRALHRICVETARGEMSVVYATDASIRGQFDAGFGRRIAWDEPLLEGYPSVVLHNKGSADANSSRSLHGRGVFSILKRERPDAILLTSLRYDFDWAAHFSAMYLQVPIWLRTETQDECFVRSRVKNTLRSWIYRLIYSNVDRALTIGRLNGEHYIRHGLPALRHTASPYCVPDRFAQLTAYEKQEIRASLRKKLGFQDSLSVLLFCGKLQRKKNPMLLLDAVAALPMEQRREFGILFVGTGELEAALRLRAKELGGVLVAFAGFKNQTQLPPYYLASDLLVLPSQQMGETWGLVVNEALLAECRVVISKHVGCARDFQQLASVRVFDGSRKDLTRALTALPRPESTTGQREYMKRYSVEAAARGIAKAMGIDTSRRPQRTGWSHLVSV